MSNWVVALIGLAVVSGFMYAAKQWGYVSAAKKLAEDNVDAAETRKKIDNEIDQLSDDDLANELDKFVRKP